MKKIGIITFHNSYNCGSMMESYAIQTVIQRLGYEVEIINFSSKGQQEIYSVRFKNNSIKNILKNIILLPHEKRIKNNNRQYEEFKNKYFNLSKEYHQSSEIIEKYDIVIAGSDQIWNITIDDYDDAYFLNWVKKAKKIAYAPSFGAKKIQDNTDDVSKYIKLLNAFDAISIRENNGQKWIMDLIDKKVPVVLDPTLLLDLCDYEKIICKYKKTFQKYIFFYAPTFDKEICKFVQKISNKYNMKVITWSSKSFYLRRIKKYGFQIVDSESPEIYLNLIKNAELVITTSFHGTIFSTIFRNRFITVKNGNMYGSDDRVLTLLKQMKLENRLMSFSFNNNYNYLEEVDYTDYESVISGLKEKSLTYLKNSLEEKNEK
ncbi:MAG: polysaccharide pyruvyl transferase family protein [Lachnospiraceae bacterium]|nr:polysaccharide pyruvyl transferase family protein [Lachnospiraceae bacterium]